MSNLTFSPSRILRETSKALLVEYTLLEADPAGYGFIESSGHEAWLPKSCSERNSDGSITIPDWLARKAGLRRGVNRGLARFAEAL